MDEELRDQIARAAAILREAGAREVYLFGSAATGKMHEGSDVDLAVSGLPPRQFFPAMGRASDVLSRPLSLVDLDEDSPFTRYLRDEGELRPIGHEWGALSPANEEAS
jgi:predicted nucleotidyltransferase